MIWDPVRAKEAEARGVNITGFLSHATDFNGTALLMEALHRGDYNLSKAIDEFVSLARRAPEPTIQMRIDEQMECFRLFGGCKKNFQLIASKVKRSVAAVLVSYYHWKSINEDGCYTKLKVDLKANSDYCAICDDGGKLICCEHCHRAFHLDCLDPPLKKVPKEKWICFHCVKSPATFRRVPHMGELKTPVKAETDKKPDSTTCPGDTSHADANDDDDKKPSAQERVAQAAGNPNEPPALPDVADNVNKGASSHPEPVVAQPSVDAPSQDDHTRQVALGNPGNDDMEVEVAVADPSLPPDPPPARGITFIDLTTPVKK